MKAMLVVVLAAFLFFATGMAQGQEPTEEPVPVPVTEEWSGVTSQGYPVYITLLYPEDGSAPVISYWAFLLQHTCQVSGKELVWGFGFFDFNIPAADFTFEFNSFQFQFYWEGSILEAEGSGTAATILAVLYQQSLASIALPPVAEKCVSGPITWTIWPVTAAPIEPPASAKPERSVTILKDYSIIIE